MLLVLDMKKRIVVVIVYVYRKNWDAWGSWNRHEIGHNWFLLILKGGYVYASIGKGFILTSKSVLRFSNLSKLNSNGI